MLNSLATASSAAYLCLPSAPSRFTAHTASFFSPRPGGPCVSVAGSHQERQTLFVLSSPEALLFRSTLLGACGRPMEQLPRVPRGSARGLNEYPIRPLWQWKPSRVCHNAAGKSFTRATQRCAPGYIKKVKPSFFHEKFYFGFMWFPKLLYWSPYIYRNIFFTFNATIMKDHIFQDLCVTFSLIAGEVIHHMPIFCLACFSRVLRHFIPPFYNKSPGKFSGKLDLPQWGPTRLQIGGTFFRKISGWFFCYHFATDFFN